MQALQATLLAVLCVVALTPHAGADEAALQQWVTRFGITESRVESSGVCQGEIGKLPSFRVTAGRPGVQLIRTALPFAPGALPARTLLKVSCGEWNTTVAPRALTMHPGWPRSCRRALVTFPYNFSNAGPYDFTLSLAGEGPSEDLLLELSGDDGCVITLGDTEVKLTPDRVTATAAGAPLFDATLLAPARTTAKAVPELVEDTDHFVWARLLLPDERWPRIIEVRLDSLGTVTVQSHVQRLEPGDATAPDLGWQINGLSVADTPPHSFLQGESLELQTSDSARSISFPLAPYDRRGRVEAHGGQVRFLRCTADESVPFQQSAWRRAAFVVGRSGQTERNALLEPTLRITAEPGAYEAVYATDAKPDLSPWPLLEELRSYTANAIKQSMIPAGDDFGNVTLFTEGQPAATYGMNRLNHGTAIFEESYRLNNPELRDTAVLWCANMYDLSIWWGNDDDFGGTRYNNASAAGEKAHEGDQNFMWRTNNASTFCTKGVDAFFLAYEETGDPRYLTALEAQVGYAKKRVHALPETTRNIGDVADFLRLYRWTGLEEYRQEALRLFQELRTTLSTGDLFTESGKPIAPELPFIDEDKQGYQNPFAKPYIIGYALAGLPALMQEFPEEPKLVDVVKAVSNFMAGSQDPTGGWRYPHPASTRVLINQSIEHAAQLARAAQALEKRGEPFEHLLDAVELTLQGRVLGFQESGTIISSLQGWEAAAGTVPEGKTASDLYAKPSDRDPSRDYTEGAVSLGSAPPEGLAYFGEVLAFYLRHRPADRLMHANPKLTAVLARVPKSPAEAKPAEPPAPPGYGMRAHLPVFAAQRVERMTFPMAWPVEGLSFNEWRNKAREAYIECLQNPPPRAPFDPRVVAVEDRGSYEARKVTVSISSDSRIEAYLLVPKGNGPFPGILALHDHGAHFSIGKEKVVKPFGVTPERMQDAQDWVTQCYGGRWIGDELATRGYAVLAIDALFWGDRGRQEGVEYGEQQALAANMLQLGMSWAGTIVWDDIRSAEYLQSLPEVDPDRIGCVGLSMGAHRTWNLCASTDLVKAGAAICWMGDTPTLMAPGNNQTKGQSSFSMTHPGLRNLLDYPDVASLACPKPMLFFNGDQDPLFPIPGVEASYAKMRRVWQSQHAEDRLVTKTWPVPHVFNVEMQEEAFAWLDKQLRGSD